MTASQHDSMPLIARALRGFATGVTGGAIGGVLLGLLEAAVVLAGSAATKDLGVLAYGAAAYGLFGASLGAAGGFALAVIAALLGRAPVPQPLASGRYAGLVACVPGFAIAAFRVRRDVFHEDLRFASGQGLVVLGACALGALLAYVVISTSVRALLVHRPFSLLLRAWASPVLLGALALLAVAFSSVPEGSQVALAKLERKPPPAEAGNVLLIVVDTLRADHLPAYGYSKGKTPHLDALAREGVVFEHFFANASWTRPSFASILTGRYASSHQTMRKSDSLPDAIVTLPEALQEAGYSTLGVVTNYNVAPFFNFHQGFDAYRYLEPEFVLGANDTAAKLLFVQFARQRIETFRAKRNQVEPGSAYQDAQKVNAELLSMLAQKPSAPWFAFVGYMDPHDPYFPHPYDGTGYSRAAHQKPEPHEAPRLRELYDGEITFWDEQFGALVAELKKLGVYEQLTIVITSDHGEEFMDHGGYWHGTTLYDEQLRVPLIVKLPNGAQGGTRVSHWVESIDLMPSLLRAQGIAVPEGVQGKDWMQPTHEPFAEEDHEGNVLRALRTRRGLSELKLIESNPGNPRGLEPLELYRTDQDPRERVSLSRETPEVLEIATKRLMQTAATAQHGRVEKQTVDVAADDAALQKLRALGYAGGDKQ